MHDKPLAAPGFRSYRTKGPYGYVMIGAKNDADALNEARRTNPAITVEQLERWCAENKKYVFIK